MLMQVPLSVSLNATYESAIVDSTLLIVVKSDDTRRKKDYIGSAAISLHEFMTTHYYFNDAKQQWSFTVELMRHGSLGGALSGKLQLVRMGADDKRVSGTNNSSGVSHHV